MAIITIGLGGLLTLLGVLGFVLTGSQHYTALIPVAFGTIFELLGLVALRSEPARKHAMHAAAALALVGFVGSAKGLLGAARMLSGQAVELPAAVVAKAVMAVLCAVFVALCVRSFVAARRAREA